MYISGNALIEDSTISNNATTGDVSRGGGLYVRGNVDLRQVTISGNQTSGFIADWRGPCWFEATSLQS